MGTVDSPVPKSKRIKEKSDAGRIKGCCFACNYYAIYFLDAKSF